MKSTKKERLREAVEFLLKSNAARSRSDIAKMLGIKSSGNFSQVLNPSYPRTLTDEQESTFLSSFNQIDRVWFLTGEGSMLRSEEEAGVPEEAKEVSGREIPLLPVSVYGGSLDGFGISGIMPYECERILSPLENAELAVPVVGDSMAPEYPNGSRVLVRRINENAFIEWGAPHVLDTCNGSVLKIITKSDEPNSIRCVSLNESPEYAPFEVNREYIYGIYRVLMCMALK